MKKSSIKLLGNKTNDWVIVIEDEQGWTSDLQVKHEELVALKKLMDKKLK